jgi:cytochrome o ubiquinol oxidase operon protein cyoD
MQTDTTHHKTSHFAGYLRGFLLALLLSVLAFGLVMVGAGAPFGGVELLLENLRGQILHLPHWLMVTGVLLLGLLQLWVHLYYFLHLDFSHDQRRNLLSLLFALLLTGIMAGGTVWVMYNMNAMMMPGA